MSLHVALFNLYNYYYILTQFIRFFRSVDTGSEPAVKPGEGTSEEGTSVNGTSVEGTVEA